MFSIRETEVHVGMCYVFVLLFGGWLLRWKYSCNCVEMKNEEVQQFRNENVKLNGPCLTLLLILRNSFSSIWSISIPSSICSPVCSALIHPCVSTAPDGVLPPRLSSATPTSLQVVWSTPARNNAPGSPRYQLQMRPGHSTHEFLE